MSPGSAPVELSVPRLPQTLEALVDLRAEIAITPEGGRR